MLYIKDTIQNEICAGKAVLFVYAGKLRLGRVEKLCPKKAWISFKSGVYNSLVCVKHSNIALAVHRKEENI